MLPQVLPAPSLHDLFTERSKTPDHRAIAGGQALLLAKGVVMRRGFLLKGAVVAALVVLFDRMFPYDIAGASIGGFAGAWLVGLLVGRRDVRRSGRAWFALAAAALFAVALVDDPGLLAWTLFWCALSIAALLPKATGFDDAWHWGVRLALHAVTGIAKPFGDLRRIWRRRQSARTGPRAVAGMLALPLAGGALFLLLFAAANPLVEQALAAIRLPSVWRLLLWVAVALCLWPSLRPHAAAMRLAGRLPDPEPRLPGTSLLSVLIALALFNAIFAVQNGLDIAFLWSGGTLPAGMTQTEYVHRGAYPLIGTALIAGVMALAMLRPGSESERHPLARRLVTVWVAQNLVLVASSALRTIDYIEASMLTAWRIAALAWMVLVALGLVLICWRILAGRSARWLINWNAAAAAIVLAVCAFADLGAIAAAWNVRARAPERIDLCYLQRVGDGALDPLIDLEQRPMDAATRDRVRYVRARIFVDLAGRQDRWREWTPRGARRLAEAQRRLGVHPAQPAPVARPAWRDCGGAVQTPPPPESRLDRVDGSDDPVSHAPHDPGRR
ncbi:DUF4173 domain-containing protein [Sphingomonas sp.]|uniref:DUF4153 domain-containing protein n=1 Tax=Sphingomonas sp. TaxID=28214 RepID=UPI0035BBF6BF